MGEVTLTVPAEYVEAFRLGAAREAESDAEWLRSSGNEMTAYLAEGRTGKDTADMHGALRYVLAAVSLVDQLVGAEGEVEVRAEAEHLAFVAEAMAREVVFPRLKGEIVVGPMDEHFMADFRPTMDALTWAVDRASEMHAHCRPNAHARGDRIRRHLRPL